MLFLTNIRNNIPNYFWRSQSGQPRSWTGIAYGIADIVLPGIIFAANKNMRKWLNIIAVLGLLILLIPQTVGLSVTRCAHSGHILLAGFPIDMDCGMSSDSDCMQHFTFKVSDFSSDDAGAELNPPQLTAFFPLPVLVVIHTASAVFFHPAIQASPPGTLSHSFLPLRN